jgi:uncharacterized membrane protein YphA (DoxX/SURF4 family)
MTHEKIQDYFVLVARILLGWTFLGYGYGKLTEGQFGITEAELVTPLKDLNLFRLSWYLFDHEPFKSFIGVSQIICGLMLIFHQTAILGAFLFLPIVSTILIIDLSFMPPMLKEGFAWRLSFYILLDFFILWHYKDRLQRMWKAAWEGVNTRYKYPVWAYLILPVLALVLEFGLAVPRAILYFFR